MKIILRADVENLGHLGDVVTVKDGYGRNYLLPQRLAMPASPANLKVFELERKKLQAKMDALRATASGMASRLEGYVVRIEMRVGENDKLYGSVTNSLICDSLRGDGLEVDRRRILLDAPIRTIGEHPVRVRLHADVTATLKVVVTPEGHHAKAASEAKPDADAERAEQSEPS
ncbi:MAG: 50S ribosomal protein L9 [Deltaproteobacteria bacterium]|jgi:large subunit ribosomal protein L9|nr:50S ribosomal protein L9 [Deltaproteobacteria bacterium]